MVKVRACAFLLACGMLAGVASAEDKPPANSMEIVNNHDRALIKDLTAYLQAHPKADDLDQAYMTLLNKAIEHDWFVENEAVAQQYLRDFPEGPIQSLARIVTTMARAKAGQYNEALTRFEQLMQAVGKSEQEEFAVNFAESLAVSASGAGEYHVARKIYQILLDRFGESAALRQKVKDELARLDMVGKPAPSVVAHDVDGKPLNFADYRGKYVLIDFWATWCAPCIVELPRVQEAFKKFHGQGLEVVGVSLDETKPAVLDFVKARGIPWRQVHGATAGGDLVEAFGVSSIPATFLISPDGNIVRIELRGANLEPSLAKILKDTPATATR
ncbi:redoxin domain-containing protein [Singulisphaera sp. PoT]|uniref:redoxin domain-containing protein n=1 Tax=Singulisphaera sp. PoT TaxID=3411797 RepID=UPI003BF4B9F9